jgi:hypothetical protein
MASATRNSVHTNRPDWVSRSRRRRSTASASDPAARAMVRIAMSWNAVSAAMARVDPVRAYTWNGRASRVIWLPIPLTTWPDHSQR